MNYDETVSVLEKVLAFLTYQGYIKDAANLEYIMSDIEDMRKEFEEFV